MLYIAGIIFIVTGLFSKIFTPKNAKSLHGYKTRYSKINKATWDEAQRYAAYSFIILGIIYASVGFILYEVLKVKTTGSISNITLLAGIIIRYIIIEKHLKKMFNPDGSLKS